MSAFDRGGKSAGLFAVIVALAGFASGCARRAVPSPMAAGPAASSSSPSSSAAAALFTDVTEQAGIRFALGHNGRTPLTILETLGSGCGLFDADGDGWLDIVLVGPNKVALYRNKRDGTFADVSAQSGLRQNGIWQGVATGDYDNDGRTDLYLSGYRNGGALYRNEGDGRFRDVTKQAGIQNDGWGASAAFADVDSDGRLDLVVAQYVQFRSTSVKYCLQGGLMSTCGPTNYDPEKPVLYHNNGDGTFRDETKKRGLGDAHGNALGIALADYDADGDIDIAVANDQLPGDLYQNDGRGRFKNVALLAGTAYNADGTAYAGMGADWADVRGDGRLALVVTAYQHQPTAFYEQTAPGLFADQSYSAGVGPATRETVGFGIKFLDYDNDGLPDLFVANGHAVDNIARTDRTTTYPQRAHLLHNAGGGKFNEVEPKVAGPVFAQPMVGRGLAAGDVDNDGRPDVVLVDIESGARLLRNTGPAGRENHFLSLRLRGTQGSNRDAIGAQVSVSANNKTSRHTITSAGSFLSASDLRVHVGLGQARQAERIVVRWPSGRTTTLRDVAADRFLTIVEGRGIAPSTNAAFVVAKNTP